MRFILVTLLFSSKVFACVDLQGFYVSCQSVKGTLVEVYDLEIQQNTSSLFMTATHPMTHERSTDTLPITSCTSKAITIHKTFPQGFMNVTLSRMNEQLLIHKSGEISGQSFQDALICQ